MSREAPIPPDAGPPTVELAPLTAEAALALAGPDLASRPWLVVSDFDGTLSPLVMDPWAAAIIPLARRALRRLAGRPDTTVALLSGRSARDLALRARVGGAVYLGNHGLERGRLSRGARAETLRATGDPAFDGYAADAERIAAGIPALVSDAWLVVERKPPAVGLHYRAAPDVPAAAERVRAAVEALDPGGRFERYPGKRMLELRPPGAATKGQALARLLAEIEPGFALVLGDDVSDVQAFRALRAARETGRTRGLALAVHARADVLPEVSSYADGVLASPREAARLLALLALTGSPRRPPAPSG